MVDVQPKNMNVFTFHYLVARQIHSSLAPVHRAPNFDLQVLYCAIFTTNKRENGPHCCTFQHFTNHEGERGQHLIFEPYTSIYTEYLGRQRGSWPNTNENIYINQRTSRDPHYTTTESSPEEKHMIRYFKFLFSRAAREEQNDERILMRQTRKYTSVS